MAASNTDEPKRLGRPPYDDAKRWEVSKRLFEESRYVGSGPPESCHWFSTMSEVAIPGRRIRAQQFAWRIANPLETWNLGDSVITLCEQTGRCVRPEHLARKLGSASGVGVAQVREEERERGVHRPRRQVGMQASSDPAELEKTLAPLYCMLPTGPSAPAQLEKLQEIWQANPLPVDHPDASWRVKCMYKYDTNAESLPIDQFEALATSFGITEE